MGCKLLRFLTRKATAITAAVPRKNCLFGISSFPKSILHRVLKAKWLFPLAVGKSVVLVLYKKSRLHHTFAERFIKALLL